MPYRQPGRQIKLKPFAVRVQSTGTFRLLGDDEQEWWTNGEAAWRSDILDPYSIELLEGREKATKEPLPVAVFWPRGARMKLEYEAQVGDLLIYISQDKKVIRAVSDYMRPPRFLFASRTAPPVVTEDQADHLPKLGRLRPTESVKNIGLVDHPDPAHATMMVIPEITAGDLLDRIMSVVLHKREAPAPVDLGEVSETGAHQDVKTPPAGGSVTVKPLEPAVVDVLEDKFPEFEKAFQKILKTAARLGAEQPTMKVIGTTEKKVYDKEGNDTKLRAVFKQVQLTFPATLKLPGDFQVLATVSQIAPGANTVVTHVPDSVKLPANIWRTMMTCEHCGKTRNRNAVYLIENLGTGERKQVGSACVDDFTGHPGFAKMCGVADSLLAQIQALADPDSWDEEEMGEGSSYRRNLLVDLKAYIELCSALIRQYGYISRANADETLKKIATADAAWQLINETKGADLHKYITHQDEDIAAKALAWARTIDPKSDFDHNLQSIASVESIPKKASGFAAALIPSYQRAVSRADTKQRQKEQLSTGDPYLPGEVGDKVTFTAKLDFQTTFDTMYGTSYLYKFIDATGRVITWKASGPAKLKGEPSFEDKRQHTLQSLHKTYGGYGPEDDVVPWGPAESLEDLQQAYVRHLTQYSKWSGPLATAAEVDGVKYTYPEAIAHFSQPLDQLSDADRTYLTKLTERLDPGILQKRLTYDQAVREIEATQPSPIALEYIEDTARNIDRRMVVGNQYQVKATIKEKGEYKGQPQTTITRASILKEIRGVGASALLASIDSIIDDLTASVVLNPSLRAYIEETAFFMAEGD